MEERIEMDKVGDNIDERMEELSKYYPKASSETLLTHDAFVFQNDVSVGKFIKSDKLDMDEKKELAKKLNEEWLETVVKPYLRTLCDFCEKYEMAIMKTKINTQAQPMMRLFLEEIGGSELRNAISDFFDKD